MASKTILVGNLGADPEKRVMPNGNSVVNTTLATTERWKDKQGNKQEEVEWHRLVVYSPLAEVLESYARKGSKLYIEGRNKTRKWTDSNGVEKYTTEVLVRNLELLDSKKQSNEPMHNEPPQGCGFKEDSIPF